MHYEPLATYLEPRFGNIYEREDEAWTPELQAAVTDYLLELPDDDYDAFVEELVYKVLDGSRAAQATFIFEHNQPWQVAYACHIAAVKAVPTFQQLMESLSDARDNDWQSDARYWLEAHATDEQLREIALRLSPSAFVLQSQAADIQYEDFADYLTDTVKPEALLSAWERVMAPEPTDLTDQEWALLEPFLSKMHPSKPRVVRQAINGMLWRQAHPGFTPMPAQFGRATLITARKHNYRKGGVFARMLAGLEGKPEAERLVAWLREVVGSAQ